jgi:hypothetical protein
MVRTGLRLVIGSWKIIETWSPRTLRIASSSRVVNSLPLSLMLPSIRPLAVGTRRMMERAVTLLPEPLSPTTATVSRASMVKETALTTGFQTSSTRNEVVSRSMARTGVTARPGAWGRWRP